MLLRFGLAGFALSALFLSACGGGGSPGPSAPAPTPSPTPSPSPTPVPCPTGTATGSGVLICRSDSTNVSGYNILLQTSGAAMITDVRSGAVSNGTASSSATSQLFSDLNANTPVVNIKTYGPCAKSASFGSITTVTYQSYTTGDISCAAPSTPAPVTTIYDDVQSVESSLGLQP